MATKGSLTNFIPISRKLFEHRFWSEEREYSKFEAWIDLVKEARFEDTKTYIGNKVVFLKRGEIPASLRFLSARWKWGKTKVDGFLQLLESDGMISKRTDKQTGQTILIICNYDKYNTSEDEPKTASKTSARHPQDSNKPKSNTVNKENNIPPYVPPIREVDVEKTWKDDFNTYLDLAKKGYEEIASNNDFIKDRERYHPELNIRLSLEKAYVDYWSTEKAWLKRKQGRSQGFNWASTYRNALTNSQNKVYKQKGEKNEQPQQPQTYVIT